MTNNFKADSSYDFSKEDYDFILELSKVGYIHILSRQVSFMDDRAGRKEFSHSFPFKNYSINDKAACDGFKLPDNWIIEHISSDENRLSITFAITRTP
jgi:hypothetical protein